MSRAHNRRQASASPAEPDSDASSDPPTDSNETYNIQDGRRSHRRASGSELDQDEEEEEPQSVSDSPEPRPPKHYATLVRKTVHVAESRVRKKWKPLSQNAQDRLRQLLLGIKDESLARQRVRSRKRKRGAVAGVSMDDHEEEELQVVEQVIGRLCGRIPKMSFPGVPASTGSTELDFSYEDTLDRSKVLEGQLSQAEESARLLRKQIQREGRALKRDEEELKGLEAGVKRKREMEGRRGGTHGLHWAARQVGTDGDGNVTELREDMVKDEGGDDELLDEWSSAKKRRKAGGKLTKEDIENDEELAPLAKQLRSHLGSMAGNTAGLEEVDAELGDAMRDVAGWARRKLGREEYRRVVGLKS